MAAAVLVAVVGAFLIGFLTAWPTEAIINSIFADSLRMAVFRVHQISFWTAFWFAWLCSLLFKASTSSSTDSSSPVLEIEEGENKMQDESPRVLDPACGSRMFWFDRSNKDAVFGDVRSESHVLCDGRKLEIRPDVQLDFSNLPFADGRFNLVVFDPPHLDNCGPKGWQGLKYGKLPEDWKILLSKGFSECFRVLAENGTLIFKWNETRIRIAEVLSLTPVKPLFGHTTTQSAKTHWMVFMKPRESK